MASLKACAVERLPKAARGALRAQRGEIAEGTRKGCVFEANAYSGDGIILSAYRCAQVDLVLFCRVITADRDIPAMHHNRMLTQFLDELDVRAAKARALQDILACVKTVADCPHSLRYDNTRPYTIGIVAGLFGVFLAGALLGQWGVLVVVANLVERAGFDSNATPIVLGVFAAALLLMSFCAFLFSFNRDGRLGEISDHLKWQAALAHNGMTNDESPADELLERLSESFSDFHRGSHSREITQAYTGYLIRENTSSSFSFYQLHFVNARIETYLENGKVKTRTVYDHFDRYYLVLPFPWVTGVSVRTDSQSEIDRPYRWDSNHPDFANYVRLTGDTMMKATRFGKPAVVMFLLAFLPQLRNPNLEFSVAGQVCLSLDDDDVLLHDAPVLDLYQAPAFALSLIHI